MSWILGAISLLLAGGNVGIVWRALVRGKTGSLVPLLGGLAGLVAFVKLPFAGLHYWWWVPLLVDLGTGYLTIVTAVFLVRRVFTRRPFGPS